MISIGNQCCTRKKFWLLGIECDLPITIHPNFLFFIFPLFRDNCSCFLEIFRGFGQMLAKNLKLETILLTILKKTSKVCQTYRSVQTQNQELVLGRQFGDKKLCQIEKNMATLVFPKMDSLAGPFFDSSQSGW